MADRPSSTSSYASSVSRDVGVADSITELSRTFHRTSLQPRRRLESYAAPPSKVPDVNSSRVFEHKALPADNSHIARQQRPIISSHYCESPHFSRLHALVEEMLANEETYYRTSFSSSQTDDDISEPPFQQSVTSTSYPLADSARLSTLSSEADESDSYRGFKRQCGDRVNGESRPSSMESIGRRNVVLRRIRVRRSFHKRRSLESGKKCDR